MSATTMNYTGFTSAFTKHIDESRRRIDAYVTTNQAKADTLLSELKNIQTEEQGNIDGLLRQLKSLQYERKGAASSKNNEKNGGGGVAERRKRLHDEQVKLEQDVSMMKSKNRVDQEQLDGTFLYYNGGHIYFSFLL